MVDPPKADVVVEGGEQKASPTVGSAQIKLIDVIVDTVSKCSDETDDGVQLQVRRQPGRTELIRLS